MANLVFNLRQKPYYEGTKTLDGLTFKFRIHWSVYSEKWIMSATGINNTITIRGTALLCGVNLWGKHGYSQLGELRLHDNSGADEDPDFYGMGERWTLEYTPVES